MPLFWLAYSVVVATPIIATKSHKSTYSLLGIETSGTSYVWGTSNELDAAIDEIKATFETMGLSEDMYSITYQKANKSQEECY